MRPIMKTTIALAALLSVSQIFGQVNRTADVQFKAAQHKEEVEGDIKGAIEVYKKLAEGKDRSIAAKALLQLARCYEKLGQADAQKTYERILRDFNDQKTTAAEARVRVTAMGGASRPAGTLTAQLLWKEITIDASSTITSDGHWLIMREPFSGDVAIRDMSSGQVKRFMVKSGTLSDSPGTSNFPILSPDLKQVAYEWVEGSPSNHYEVRVMANAAGSKSRVLISDGYYGPMPSAWSPDGKSILALVWKQDKTTGQLVWISATDGAVKVIKQLDWRTSTSVRSRPSLSPDGRYIAYPAFDQQNHRESSIYVIAADGSGETALVKMGGINDSPVWTPDGKHVVYTSNRSDGFGLWSIAVQDGKPVGAPTRIKGNLGPTLNVGFTRSGTLYYLNYSDGEEATFIADLDPATGNLRSSPVRFDSSFGGDNPTIAWSPDAKLLALARREELVLRSADGGEVSAIKIPKLGGNPIWFRDGKTLLQAARDDQYMIYFHRVNVQSREIKELFATGAGSNSLQSALSSDEKTLYSNAGSPATSMSPAIYAYNVVTGEKKLVFSAKDNGVIPSLALSPDGHTLVFKVSYPKKRNEEHICLIGVDGTNFRELYLDVQPRDVTIRPQLQWTRDGRSILFTRLMESGWQLMRIPAAGGTPEFTGLSGKGDLTNIDLNADGSRIAFNDVVSTATGELWSLDNVMLAMKAAH
jgi:Tol biopolymer transport system component